MSKFFKILLIALIIETALISGWFLFLDDAKEFSLPEEKLVYKETKQEDEKIIQENDIEKIAATKPEDIYSKGDETILLVDVPFTTQAPFANWSDARQQDGCEEAAAIMAVKWARGESLTKIEAERLVTDVSDWELENFGGFHDTSAKDTMERIFKGYFDYENVKVLYNIQLQDIIRELQEGNMVIVPTNGQLLYNPYFTPPGPERHMFPIVGYDFKTKEFIVNDNGTSRGENFRYSKNILFNAVLDYPTGNNIPIQVYQKAMIVVTKES